MIKSANLGLRFILELCAIASVAYWGFQISPSLLAKIILGLGAPLVVAVVWGVIVSPKAKISTPAPVRLVVELIVWVVAVYALASTGQTTLAGTFSLLIGLHLALAYTWKQR